MPSIYKSPTLQMPLFCQSLKLLSNLDGTKVGFTAIGRTYDMGDSLKCDLICLQIRTVL